MVMVPSKVVCGGRGAMWWYGCHLGLHVIVRVPSKVA